MAPGNLLFPLFATDGGLISYGPDEVDMFRRTAGYVDRILKGAKVGDLPVQQPTSFRLVINRKTAKTIGIQIPVLTTCRADEVIDEGAMSALQRSASRSSMFRFRG